MRDDEERPDKQALASSRHLNARMAAFTLMANLVCVLNVEVASGAAREGPALNDQATNLLDLSKVRMCVTCAQLERNSFPGELNTDVCPAVLNARRVTAPGDNQDTQKRDQAENEIKQ